MGRRRGERELLGENKDTARERRGEKEASWSMEGKEGQEEQVREVSDGFRENLDKTTVSLLSSAPSAAQSPECRSW